MSQIAHPVLKHGDLGEFWDKYQRHKEILSEKGRVVWGHSRGGQDFVDIIWDANNREREVHAYLASEGRIRAMGTIVDASKDWLSHYEELVPHEDHEGRDSYRVWFELATLDKVEHHSVVQDLLDYRTKEKFTLKGGAEIRYALERK